MFDKFAIACMSTYFKAKNKIAKLGKSEDGMETLETVILIGIAVLVAGFIVNFLTKGTFEGSDKGLIGYMFDQIGKAIKGIFQPAPAINGAPAATTTV